MRRIFSAFRGHTRNFCDENFQFSPVPCKDEFEILENMALKESEAIKRKIIDLTQSESKDEQQIMNLLDLLELKTEKRCNNFLQPTLVTSDQKPGKKLGNPAVVGLAGFGVTTLLLQMHNFGLIKIGPVLWLGVFYGGLAQLVAGLMEYGNGNNFGFSAFTTYGAFWLSFAATQVANQYTKFTVDDTTLAFYLAAFGIYTSIMLVASLRHNLTLTFVFATLAAGFWLLAASHFLPDVKALKFIGAGVLTACALGALYLMSHLIMLESFGFDLLPAGPALVKGKRLTKVDNQPVALARNGCGDTVAFVEPNNQNGVTMIHLNTKT